jgi:hypothetical protein
MSVSRGTFAAKSVGEGAVESPLSVAGHNVVGQPLDGVDEQRIEAKMVEFTFVRPIHAGR